MQEEHGAWCGFQPGEVIDDHDAALGYVLHYYPKLLPSFAGLPHSAQRSVRFTQCKMEYNMGWLVQAEAPPGALLSTLRGVVLSGNALQEDLAFYFVHWFTDLAGAVPTPLAGSEKFVLGFPLKVLSSFVSSFSIVGSIGRCQSETQVCESYLLWRWESHRPPLGPPPEGHGAIAKMRRVLLCERVVVRTSIPRCVRAYSHARMRDVLQDVPSSLPSSMCSSPMWSSVAQCSVARQGYMKEPPWVEGLLPCVLGCALVSLPEGGLAEFAFVGADDTARPKHGAGTRGAPVAHSGLARPLHLPLAPWCLASCDSLAMASACVHVSRPLLRRIWRRFGRCRQHRLQSSKAQLTRRGWMGRTAMTSRRSSIRTA